jgi:hypothetical protein
MLKGWGKASRIPLRCSASRPGLPVLPLHRLFPSPLPPSAPLPPTLFVKVADKEALVAQVLAFNESPVRVARG